MVSSPSPSRGISTIAGRYAIRRKLGAGGLGTVYLAEDLVTRRRVALKLIDPARLGDGGIESIQEEFKALASLRHRQIAEAHDFGFTEGRRAAFYTREYIEGEPLRPGPPPPGRDARAHLRPLLDLLDALAYLHAHDILHLDIHPGNLIEARDEKRGSVLIDFGLLRSTRNSAPSRPLDRGGGLPPELLAGGSVGPTTDLYSVARLLLYRLGGPRQESPPLPREIPGWGPRVTLELERIAIKGLQREAERRFQSAEELRDALSKVLGETAAERPAAELREIIVGRAAEIEAIESCLREAAAGSARVLWFTGQTGIGKSRLLAEGRQRGQLRGLEVLALRFLPGSLAGPSLPQALCALRGRAPGRAWLGALSVTHGGSTRERAVRAVEAFFAEEGDPVVLVLDDVEHADRESRLLLEALAHAALEGTRSSAGGRGLALILASEAQPADAALRRAARGLRPLKRRDARELIRGLLKPFRPPATALEAAQRAARGLPLALRRAAKALKEQAAAGRLDEPLPVADLLAGTRGDPPDLESDPLARDVARALAVLERPAAPEEVAAAVRVPPSRVRAALRRLEALDAASRHAEKRRVVYSLADPRAAPHLLDTAPAGITRRMHARMVALLRARPESDLASRKHLARHLLAAGRVREGRNEALRVANAFQDLGRPLEAVRVLSEASRRERHPRWRLRFAESTSTLLEEAGDHQEAIAVLEPIHRDPSVKLDARSRVRVCRRLGIHHHRAGDAARANELFAEVRRAGDPGRDVEEFIIVESELAELHTLRGAYEEAETACRRGLDLLSTARRAGESFRGSMEVMLRASLGHLELRRMRLERARRELEAAAALARRFGTTTTRARILNNLGVVHNNLNRLSAARRAYTRARRLHEQAGDQRGVILTLLNLATIAAKVGDARAARGALERALGRLPGFPDRRLRFHADLASGIVAHLLGSLPEAAVALRAAILAGRALGDEQLVAFARVYLAETLLASARYAEALAELRSLAGRASSLRLPVIERMVESRLQLVHALLGRRSSRREPAPRPPAAVGLLDAWNDLFAGAARLAAGEPCGADLERARRALHRLGIPAGRRLALVAKLYDALACADLLRVRALVREIEPRAGSSHRLLDVLEPAARAEAYLELGALDTAAECLDAAQGAIVGMPFLEIDWRMECLRAEVARRRGEREEARLHLHRALHTRDLIARSLPSRLRRTFLAHPRFARLAGLEKALSAPSPTPVTAPATGDPGGLGLVAISHRMRSLVEMVLRLRDQDLSVLITGETGSGKELVARSIHRCGPRQAAPFLSLHSASLPAELFESELFGHEAGSFTGAEESRPGLLEHVHGGTLFLDEVASLPLASQARLLRVVESGVARRIGGLEPRRVDVRFIASTSENIEKLTAEGAFRRDLYHRLAVVRIDVPPLRERRGDLPELARRLLEVHARRLKISSPPPLTDATLELLEGHEWPGNVRELESVLVRFLLAGTARGEQADAIAALLPAPSRRPSLFDETAIAGRKIHDLHRELDRVYLSRLFRDSRGDLEAMAAALGIKVSNVYHWLKRVGLDIRDLRRGL